MKKIEIILGCMFIWGCILRILDIPGVSILVVCSSILLILMYCILAYYLLNGKKLRDMFKKSNYLGTGLYKTLVSIFTGWALASFVTGTTFVVMYYSGRHLCFINGCVWLIISAVILLAGMGAHRQFAVNCLNRIGIVAADSCIVLLLVLHKIN